MSEKSIEFLKNLDEKQLADILVISLLGTLGLFKINQDNNLLKLKLKKYKQLLNTISDKGLDIYWLIQEFYNRKKLKFDYALKLINALQQFRKPNFSLSLNEIEIKELLSELPPQVYRLLNGDIKLLFKSYINNVFSLTKLVNKFFSYSQRKNYKEIDFYELAKVMKRSTKEEEENETI